MIKALILDKKEDEKIAAEITDISLSDLPEGDVLVDVHYSTLNYKDSLAITSSSPIVKNFPMIPGIDLSGIVEKSSNENFKAGDKVVLNGFGIGEKYWGGMCQKARVKGNWLVRIPSKFSLKQAMAIGTAGYTAMLCVLALEKNEVTPDKGEILVTGATGGVGSIAVSLLKKLGFDVCASSGRSEYSEYLKSIGAKRIINRSELSEKGKPLAKETWAGAIDSVGSYTLANICASTKYRGTVAACGLAQGYDFSATVMPFILRGIKLVGVDSVYCPMDERIRAWKRLADDLDLNNLEKMTSLIPLNKVIEASKDMLSGNSRGRIVVDVKK